MQRAIGSGRLTTKHLGGRTRIADMFQHANAKIRVPKQHADHLDAVLINTAGGLTGGDQLSWTFRAGRGTTTVIATQACERIYKSSSGAAMVTNKFELEANSHLLWLPQETILFEGSALNRQFNASMHETSRLTALEIIVMGREAMNETISDTSLIDRWWVEANSEPIHADAVRFNSASIERLSNQASLAGHRVFGTLIDIAPSSATVDPRDRVARLNALQASFEANEKVQFGFSIFDKKTITRFTARTSYDLRLRLPNLLKEFVPEYSLPSVWRL
ncbi:MAG: urease accessory protein UreD [Pseudomonadota bacterium]